MIRRSALALVLAALAFAPVASGWVQDGKPWPGATLSVWNDTEYSANVRDAVWAWNHAGADVRLVGARDRRSADVVVRYGATTEQGQATVGYTGRGSAILLSHGLGAAAASALAAHELGHVLGLGHETRACSVMTPVIEIGAASRCSIAT